LGIQSLKWQGDRLHRRRFIDSPDQREIIVSEMDAVSFSLKKEGMLYILDPGSIFGGELWH